MKSNSLEHALNNTSDGHQNAGTSDATDEAEKYLYSYLDKKKWKEGPYSWQRKRKT